MIEGFVVYSERSRLRMEFDDIFEAFCFAMILWGQGERVAILPIGKKKELFKTYGELNNGWGVV